MTFLVACLLFIQNCSLNAVNVSLILLYHIMEVMNEKFIEMMIVW